MSHTKKVKLLTSLAGVKGTGLIAGQYVTLPAESADRMVANGQAEFPKAISVKDAVEVVLANGGSVEVANPEKHADLVHVIGQVTEEVANRDKIAEDQAKAAVKAKKDAEEKAKKDKKSVKKGE